MDSPYEEHAGEEGYHDWYVPGKYRESAKKAESIDNTFDGEGTRMDTAIVKREETGDLCT